MTQTTKAERANWLVPAAVGVVAGLVIGAGGVYLLGGADAASSSEAGSDADAGPDADAKLTLPEELDGLRVESVVIADTIDNEAAQQSAGKREEIREEVTASLSVAHDGAATTSQSYADEELKTRVTVYAVAAPLPGLWSSEDAEGVPELLGMATPTEWVETAGGAQCLVAPKEFLMAGTDPEEVEVLASQCQVVRDGVTVILEPSGQLNADRSLELVQIAADNLVIN